jgi:hypothetical protein
VCRCRQVSGRLGRWHARAGRDHGRGTSSHHRRAGGNRRRGLSRTRTARTQVRTLKSKVGAAEASLIRGVHNDAEISDEGGRVLLSGQVQVDVALKSWCQHKPIFNGGLGLVNYFAEKLGPVMFPCLPDRSPTSHLSGSAGLHLGISVAPYGSK